MSADTKRILILALSKSGTTLLFHMLKRSLPPETTCFFEPPVCRPENAADLCDKNVLAKVLLQRTNGYDHYGPEACSFFDKRIFIRRDPRDLLVSVFLYSSYHLPFTADFGKFSQFMSALRAKERCPKNVSFVDLWNLHIKLTDNGWAESAAFDAFLARLRYAVHVSRAHGDGLFHISYEDLVERRLTALEQYLQMRLATTDEVDSQYQRVVRSKTHSDWRNWFVEKDVDFLRPRLAEYMGEFHCDDDWDLPDNPTIRPENASGYVMRLAGERGCFKALRYDVDAFAPDAGIASGPVSQPRPHLLSGIQPTGRVEQPSRGASIVDPHVETPDGRRVNMLVDGERYVYVYDVKFFQPCRGVSCCLTLKSASDARIASHGTGLRYGLTTVEAGAVVRAKFDFVCNFGQGIFFFNAEVTNSEDGVCEPFAHQIVHASAVVVGAAGAEKAEIAPRPLTT